MASTAFMLCDELHAMDSDLDAYKALRAVAFANDGSAHQNAYRFLREIILVFDDACGFHFETVPRPQDEGE